MIGEIIEINEDKNKVFVLWNDTVKIWHNFGNTSVPSLPSSPPDDKESSPSPPKYEVNLCDESLSRNIFVKGMPGILDGSMEDEIWSTYGLRMEQDASLSYYAVSGKNMMFTLKGKTRIPADTWSNYKLHNNILLLLLLLLLLSLFIYFNEIILNT